jgi:Zn-dependent peptidase ImmA (M78 family)
VPAAKLEAAIKLHLDALVLSVDAPPGISGAAFRMPGQCAILINRNEPAGRRNFDLAHECFHLLTWEQMRPEHTEMVDASTKGNGRQKRIEQLANAFAAALLMPRKAVESHWKNLGRRDVHGWLNETATEFQVTAKALKWRIVQLGLFERSKLSEIDDDRLTSNGQRGKPAAPKRFNHEFAKRFQEGIEAGSVSVRRAASLLGTTIDGLAEIFREHDVPVPFEL